MYAASSLLMEPFIISFTRDMGEIGNFLMSKVDPGLEISLTVS